MDMYKILKRKIKKKDRKRECLAIPRKKADILTMSQTSKSLFLFIIHFIFFSDKKKKKKHQTWHYTEPPLFLPSSHGQPWLTLSCLHKRNSVSLKIINLDSNNARISIFLMCIEL